MRCARESSRISVRSWSSRCVARTIRRRKSCPSHPVDLHAPFLEEYRELSIARSGSFRSCEGDVEQRFEILVLLQDHLFGLPPFRDVPVCFKHEAVVARSHQAPSALHEQLPSVFSAMMNFSGPGTGGVQFGENVGEGQGRVLLRSV